MRTFLIILAGTLVLAAGCGPERSTEVQTETHEHAAAESNTVTLSAKQMQTVGMVLGPIERKNLNNAIKASGMLSVPNQNKAFVSSLSSGLIRSLHVHPGSSVRKGQRIATLTNPELAGLQQQLLSVEAQISLNETELRRQQELVAGNAAPLKNVQRVQAELSSLRASRQALQKQLAAMGVPGGRMAGGAIVTTIAVNAPISGTVSEVMARIGSHVDASAPIAEIVNNNQLHLDLFVYEKDLPKLQNRQVIHFTLTNNPGREYDAQIFSIGTAFTNETKTITVHAEVQGDKTGLIDGMNITALISMGRAVVPAVPEDAIVSHQGQDYIFVLSQAPPEGPELVSVDKDHEDVYVFRKLPVIRGTSELGYTEIRLTEPLPVDARIITKGAFFAMAKAAGVTEHDH